MSSCNLCSIKGCRADFGKRQFAPIWQATDLTIATSGPPHLWSIFDNQVLIAADDISAINVII